MRPVKEIQEALKKHGYDIKVDGIFGPLTKEAIIDFQEKNNLYSDGIVGPITSIILFKDPTLEYEKKLNFTGVLCDLAGVGFGITHLREDVAPSFIEVVKKLHSVGAVMTSAGGRRSLDADLSSNRSSLSLHYCGLAHDLSVYSGMVDPHTDPYVITKGSEERTWIVYARCSSGKGSHLKLKGFTFQRTEVETEGDFINLTDLFSQYGWKGIRARSSFFTGKRNDLGSEYWHWQAEHVLTPNVSTFGGELLKSYTASYLRKYSVWNYRDRVWKKDWF